MFVKTSKDPIESFNALVSKSNNNQKFLAYHSVVSRERTSISKAEDNFYSVFANSSVPVCQPCEEGEEDPSDTDHASIDHPLKYSVVSALEVGAEVKYIKDDNSEKGILLGINLSDPSNPPIFTIEFKDGRTQQTTREHIELVDTPDPLSIPTKVKSLIEVASAIPEEVLNKMMNPEVLTPLQELWIWWHETLDHLPRLDMNHLVDQKILPSKFAKLKNWKFLCPSCIFAQQPKRSWRSKSKPSKIAKDDIKDPGDMVCIDHLISIQPGLMPRISGRHTTDRITATVMFKDVISGFTYGHLMTSCDLEQTLEAKYAFEKLAATYGVKIKRYHADNGHFACKGFREAVSEAGQKITFCGVGAHHQNGIIENQIGLITRWARTSLLHAKRRWPSAITTLLWPYALKTAIDRYNDFHFDKNGLTPHQKFAKTSQKPIVSNRHPWGCPIFVLTKEAQGSKSPKWEPRSRMGIYLGNSPTHAGSVAMVLNPKTLHVSPQYHVIFDDTFSTVEHMEKGTIPPNWKELVAASEDIQPEETKELDNLWNNPALEESENEEQHLDDESVSNDSQSTPRISNKSSEMPDELFMPIMPDLDSLSCRRSSRLKKPPDRFDPTALSTSSKANVSSDKPSRRKSTLFSMICLVSTAISDPAIHASIHSRLVYHTQMVNQHFDGTWNHINPFAYSTEQSGNDVYTFKEMLKQPDKNEFIKAMMAEIKDHESRQHWVLFKRSSIPKGHKTIMAIWSFKRKRYPDGTIYKYKARLCAHGGMQQWGIDFWETYAPVVNWLSVRTLLTLSVVHSWHSRSIDFVLAFPQADLDHDVFMEFPAGVCSNAGTRKEYVLKLKKNLYGLKDAAHNWFQLLSKGLTGSKLGFKPSSIDPCVFLRKDAIMLTWVDDCLIFSKDLKVVTQIVDTLKEDFDVELEEDINKGDVSRYLGMIIDRNKDQSFEIRQPFLIDRILALLELDDNVKSRPTPVTKPLLHKDLDGPPRVKKWKYRSAIGMLTYLFSSSRPEIGMAVHQCARFSVDPKLTHERAVMRIGKYLLETRDRGIRFKPDKSRGVECFVDADFAGSWTKEDSGNPANVLSRTGYVIFYYGCPVVYCSKLQTEIALSTAEAEYIALSQATREIIPLMNLLKEIKPYMNLDIKDSQMYCTIHEDNTSCITMAQSQRFTPRTKHISLKYHWFRAHLNGPNKLLNIVHVTTKEQIADILTKPLDENSFKYLRKKLNGW